MKNTANNAKEKSIFQKILEVISSIFAVIVIIACLWVLVFKVVFKTQVVKIFGYSGLVVLTGSMEPTIHAGDVIIIRELDNYEVNDIITFSSRNMIVTHRIRKIEDGQITTKGDANNSEDLETITMDKIEGKVVKRIPKVGKVIIFFQQPIGIISLVFILGALEFFFAAKRKLAEEGEECQKRKKL